MNKSSFKKEFEILVEKIDELYLDDLQEKIETTIESFKKLYEEVEEIENQDVSWEDKLDTLGSIITSLGEIKDQKDNLYDALSKLEELIEEDSK